MKRLLLDTSYIIGHFHTGDIHHSAALDIQDDFMNGKWDELVLLDSVLVETVTVLGCRTDHATAKLVGRTLRTSDEIIFAHAGPLMDAAWEEFVSQPADDLSLVDCTLIAAATQHKIHDVATFDTDFDDVIGVNRVPRPVVTASR